ncbi:GNAT family N-acetyltransferase [Paenibacillus sepulcri]|uniref:GNAT family N-acetyltransferase n=1 Tax=Paenibacillus sepulcri TaxID=359917 RepID=A0ABS7C8S7_9BACL|nr:GNAT family N-acetyltransferase [Paenibacillus sepulcri]
MKIRLVKGSDYYLISPLINDWWGGRQISGKLPKLFFDHFSSTSFIAEKEDEMIGFLIGFLSQTHPNEAYIHFAGVHPEYRKHHVGKQLYDEFFHAAKQNGRSIVRCITSPVNKGSIAFHTRMGFEIEAGNKEEAGVSVHADYDGANQDRVLLVKTITHL